MAKKRAFVRYSKNGKLVPGSLIVTQGTHPDKPSTWKEVPYDICCGGGTIQLPVYSPPLPLDPIVFPDGVAAVFLYIQCSDQTNTEGVFYRSLTSPSGITLVTFSDVIDFLNTYFNYPGFTWVQTGPSTLEVIIDKNFLVGNCQNPDNLFLQWEPYFPA